MTLWTIVGIYAPQSRKESCFLDLIKKINYYGEGTLLLLGDFNSVMNGELDKSDAAKMLAEIIGWKTWLNDQYLTDIWRDRNKLRRDSTYYSGRHKSYSRIDYIF